MSGNYFDRKWLEEIFDTYYDKVNSFLYARVRNKALAEDLASQTFLKIAERLDTYEKAKGSLSTWIFTIALNEARDYFRKNNNREHVNIDDVAELSDNNNLEESYIKYEEKQALLSLLNNLNERQYRIIALKYYGGLSNKEIASIIGLSQTNVSTLLNRSIDKLKKLSTKCDKMADFAYKVTGGQNL